MINQTGIKQRRKPRFTTMEIVIIAIVAIVIGIANTYINIFNLVLTAIGGPILTSVIMGLHALSGLITAYIIRKPGTALFTFTLGGVVQLLTGNPNGIMVVLNTVTNGIGIELAFAMFKYKQKWSWFGMGIAGALSMPIWFVIASFYFGYIEWGWPVLLIAFLTRCVSGVVLGGWISKWIGRNLASTGILKGFRVDKDENNPNAKDLVHV